MANGKQLTSNDNFLRFLHDANLRQRKQLLRTASNNQLQSLCECAFNILRRNVPLNPSQLHKLQQPRTRKLVYQLASRKVPIAKKRKLLVQSGGLPILPILAPIIASVLSTLISR